MMRISWVGTGAMGAPMAKCLIDSGFELSIYNRTRGRADELIQCGAHYKETPREAVASADIIFCTVLGNESSDAVWEGPHGILSGLKENAIVIECSTLTPEQIKMLSDRVHQFTKSKFIAAPLIGTPQNAKHSDLLFLVGGEQENIEKVRGILELMSKDIFVVGNPVQASALKLAITGAITTQILLMEELNHYLNCYQQNEETMAFFNQIGFVKPVFDIIKHIKSEGDFSKMMPKELIDKDLGYLADSQLKGRAEGSFLDLLRSAYSNVSVTKEGFCFSR